MAPARRGAGYKRYEISNYALPEHTCRHNQLYWSGGSYIGLGPSAHSHWKGARYSNVANLARYTQGVLGGEDIRDMHEELSPEEKARETLVMQLRQTCGVNRADFLAQTGFDYSALASAPIDALLEEGLLIEDEAALRLAEDAFFVSDAIFSQML